MRLGGSVFRFIADLYATGQSGCPPDTRPKVSALRYLSGSKVVPTPLADRYAPGSSRT